MELVYCEGISKNKGGKQNVQDYQVLQERTQENNQKGINTRDSAATL